MVRGSMALSGVGNVNFIDVKMGHIEYRSILRNNLKVFAQRLGLGSQWVYQQDNDPKHTVHEVKEWVLSPVARHEPNRAHLE